MGSSGYSGAVPRAPHNLNRMLVFAAVVERSSFTEAAERLHVSRGAVSKQIAALEGELGVRLLNRTTRRVRPTEAGLTYYESCCRVIAEADRVQRRLSKLQSEPLGRLRVNAPVLLGRTWLAPLVFAFMRSYGELDVDLNLQDDFVDLIAEHVDVAIRIGPLADSTLVVRKLARVRQVICGAPAYWKRQGQPRGAADLAKHEWLTFSHSVDAKERVRLTTPAGRRQVVRVTGRLRTNNGDVIRDALLSGVGITMLPEILVAEDLTSGRLHEVLPKLKRPLLWLSAVYPHTREVASKVRLFVDYLQNALPAQEAH